MSAYLDGSPDSGACGPATASRLSSCPQGAAGRRRPGHPAAPARRLAGAGRAQGGSRHRDHPGGHRLGRRRSPRGLALGAAVYLLKPVSRDDLLDALRRVGAARSAPDGVVVTPRRILVVEDNPLNLKLVRDVLQFAGYDVIEAQSGEEGLRSPASDPPDLVLMDLQLPGIDGTETLHRMRRTGSEPGRAGRRGHRLRDGRGPRAAPAPASTATSRSRSACAHCPTRSRRSSPGRGAT